MAEESKIIANEIIKPSGVQEKPLEERNIEVMKEHTSPEELYREIKS